MKTCHQVFYADARDLGRIADESVNLIVTSPPYPMIEMWDAAFARMNPRVERALAEGNGAGAFELMHLELDKVWRECFRVLRVGGIACVNIGDAVRTVAGSFRMYSNHARIVQAMGAIGFVQLPDILWRKPTNAPNKFMGSGMLPAGAYVTYEHEYILIFRKGERRAFKTPEERRIRRESAFFWEERNVWFSDVWTDLKGIGQELTDSTARQRSAAYPFELAYRLICMHSVYGDKVLDPFLGTGTTMTTAIASGRNSIGVELDEELERVVKGAVEAAITAGRQRVSARLAAHRAFFESRREAGKAMKYRSSTYGFPVVTAQERDLVFYVPQRLGEALPERFVVECTMAP